MLRIGGLVFAALALLLSNHAAARATTSRCLTASEYASRLIVALDPLHLSHVQAISSDITQHCANSQSPGTDVVADAATLFTFIHRRTNADSAQRAFNRLLQQDFSSLPPRPQTA